MSETTRKLRKFGEGCEGHKLIDWYHMYLGMELAADVIEAVEAQVAEAVARVEKLSACVTATDDSLSDWAERHEKVLDRLAALEEMGRLGASPNGDDRTRGDMSPRGFGSPTPDAPTPPAPSAVPAPRGFKKGDVVRTGGLSPFDAVVVEVREPQREDWNVTIKADRGTYKWHGPDLTLVRAADAPEAPAEDAGLVERCAKLEAQRNAEIEAHAKTISELVEAERLVGMNANDVRESQDWAVMAEAEREALRHALSSCFAALECGAQLPAKRMEAIRALLSAPGKTEDWKARAEAAEKALAEARAISAATAERVRSETQIATELRKDLADANDRLTSQSRSIEEMHAEMVDLRAKLAAAEKETLRLRSIIGPIDGHPSGAENLEARWRTLRDRYGIVGEHTMSALMSQLDERASEAKNAEKERDALRAELDSIRAALARVDGAK